MQNCTNTKSQRGDGGVELLDTKLEHDDVVRSVTVNHDMSKALSASDDSTLRVWDMLDASSTASISCLQGHAAPVLAGAWADVRTSPHPYCAVLLATMVY